MGNCTYESFVTPDRVCEQVKERIIMMMLCTSFAIEDVVEALTNDYRSHIYVDGLFSTDVCNDIPTVSFVGKLCGEWRSITVF